MCVCVCVLVCVHQAPQPNVSYQSSFIFISKIYIILNLHFAVKICCPHYGIDQTFEAIIEVFYVAQKNFPFKVVAADQDFVSNFYIDNNYLLTY